MSNRKTLNKISDDFKTKWPYMSDQEKTIWKYQRYMQDYLATISSVDDNVGRVLDYLDNNNLTENTIVVFTSDNGGLTTQNRIAPTSVYPLRAGKGWLYEGGIKIPQLIKLPKQVFREIR